MLNVKRSLLAYRFSVDRLVTFLLLFLISLPYFIFIALPALTGLSQVAPYVGDSFGYHKMAEMATYDFQSALTAILGLKLAGGYFSFFGITYWGYFLKTIFGKEYYFYAVYIFNVCLLYLTVCNFKKTLISYECSNKKMYLGRLLLMVNPALYTSLVSLNKEIWCIYFVSSFIYHYSQRNKFLYFSNLFLALFFRDSIFLVGLIYYFIPKSSKYLLYLMWLLSVIVVPVLMLKVEMISMTGKILGAHSGDLFQFFMNVESYPFGYALTFPIKILIQLFAGTLPHHYLEWTLVAPYHIALTISSLLFLIICVFILMNFLRSNFLINKNIIIFVFVYLLIFCMIPYSVHRQFIALYIPLILLLVVGLKFF